MNFIFNESAQKLRGGYYTPEDLAEFLCRWVLEIEPKSVLEPSCGDGAFFGALQAAGVTSKLSVTAFELNPEEAAKAAKRSRDVGITANVHARDFLQWFLDDHVSHQTSFDCVVGNPPFIRYQYLPAPFQARAEQVFRDLNLTFTKHTNAWVPFVLAGMKLLRPGGRLAMVVPAEIIHVMHAQSLRSYLGMECHRIVIIDPEELWFKGTLQGAVLLLAEKLSKGEHAQGLGIVAVKNREFIRRSPARIFSEPQSINGTTISGKWTPALLSNEERALLVDIEENKDVFRFGEIAQVDVGIVTGANKFFLVTDDTVENHGLKRWAYPMFGRSEHCPGVVYDSRQHRANAQAGLPTNFLWFSDNGPLRFKKSRAYIEMGEKAKLHERYKCRIREPWYRVPSVYATEVGMLKRAHDHHRLILNKHGAYTTDTAYRVRPISGVPATRLVGCFVNALTAVSAELEGRHYGGGVLELVPSEIERLIVPLPRKAHVDLGKLDLSVRKSTANALAANTRRVLGGVGLSRERQMCLLNAWKRLRDRRHRNSTEESGEFADVAQSIFSKNRVGSARSRYKESVRPIKSCLAT